MGGGGTRVVQLYTSEIPNTFLPKLYRGESYVYRYNDCTYMCVPGAMDYRNKKIRLWQKMIPSERASQEEQNGANFSFVTRREFNQNHGL